MLRIYVAPEVGEQAGEGAGERQLALEDPGRSGEIKDTGKTSILLHLLMSPLYSALLPAGISGDVPILATTRVS